MGENVNGHSYVQIAQATRELMLSQIMDALTALVGFVIEQGPHPTKPGVLRFSVRLGPIVASKDESEFKLKNFPQGEIALAAAMFGVCLQEVLATHYHAQAATALAPYIDHKADCDLVMGVAGGICTCGLAALVVRGKPPALEVVSG